MHIALRAADREPGSPAPVDADEAIRAGGESSRYLCRACRSPITTRGDEIAVAGQHVHVRANPHGVSFAFGCFGAAAGASCAGGPTAEHTWFAGHAWVIALCAGCGAHLGWRFDPGAGTSGFFGLILDRLVVEDDG